LGLAARKTEELVELEAVFRAEPAISDERVKKIALGPIHSAIRSKEHQRREVPLLLFLELLRIKNRAEGLLVLAGIQGQTEIREKGADDCFLTSLGKKAKPNQSDK